MTRADQWLGGEQTVEHTFSTGRTAILRRALPILELVRRGAWDETLVAAFDNAVQGETNRITDAVRLMDAVVCGMFVDPVVTVDGADGSVPVGVLADAEVQETMEAAFGGAALDSFRAEPDGSADRGDGAVLGGDTVEPAGGAGDARRAGAGRADAGTGGRGGARRGRAA